ncbi:DoxX family protein [Heyndrickxia oleronia]|uniref:DoxX family protein n=1 Tax=Heyndrickxia oleronia TaxID=38875 RepID=UPI00242BE125|nr:DoxX family protein [Heyndrickxia oleronia]MCI1590505.1 DoxX family protein [Heyndrickxia oleronia]MCI1612543.1 DoxX family protein [Heyndrickxia oleronia]MCI1743770.1 DoxX family protein [Heyndrickxia oleronia]MCI1760480.1 DoxX family protein [Heyndrickxia oleronia]
MAPFIVLIVGFLLFSVIGYFELPLNEWQTSLRLAVALMFLFTAMAHWGKRRQGLIKMVPSSLPYPHFIVTITGILEIIGALGLLIPITSKIASICLVILLIVMFPANIHAAKVNVRIGEKPVTPLFLRTILQIIFVTAVILAGWY